MLIYDDIRFKLNNMKPKLSDLRQALDLDKGQEEIAALEKQSAEPGFWDDRYFGQSTLNDYLQTLPPEQVVETDSMRLYLLDPDLVSVAQSALAQRNDAALFGQH